MSVQNTSHAVMAQRHEPHDSLDFFPTPPWATRALCEWLQKELFLTDLKTQTVWEPACGEGHMARPLGEYFGDVRASDVHSYGYGEILDFIWPRPDADAPVDWIITNPPFNFAMQFAEAGRDLAHEGVALLVRTAFLESVDRYERLFRRTPPSDILQFVERVPMHKGRLVKNGSTATAYCWIVWRNGVLDTRFHWIPPCRKRLERPEDYDEIPPPA